MVKALQKIHDRMRKLLSGGWIHRTLGERLFHGHLWAHDKRAVAGGLALGLFIAFTPTIPLQMLLAAMGAIHFRVNVPIALAACWVTNPLTAGPIYLTSWRVGRYIIQNIGVVHDFFDSFGPGRMNAVVKQSAYLWTGSLLFASVAALVAYLVVIALWRIVAKWHESRLET
jgi:uncharacterized protein